MPEIIRVSWPTSRGKVSCALCKRTIASGVIYHQVVGTDMGKITTSRLCQTCNDAEVATYIWLGLEPGDDENPDEQDIREWAQAHIQEYPENSRLARGWLGIMGYDVEANS